jgi:phage terminase small subunit
MAIGGQKPKAAETRVAMGNPGKRPIPKTPAFKDGSELQPPKRWGKRGFELEEWNRLVPELVRVKVAKAVHQAPLEKICELYAASVRMYRAKDYTGFRMAADAHRKALTEFGLTPSSAARIGAGGGGSDDEDPAEAFFSGPRLTK